MQSATAYLIKLDPVLTLIFQHKSFNTLNNNWLHQDTDESSDISRQRWVITAPQRHGGRFEEESILKSTKQKDESAHCMMGKQGSSSWAAASVHVYA